MTQTGSKMTTKIANHFKGKVKSAAKTHGKKEMKNYLKKEKSFTQSVSDWFTNTKNEVDPTTGTPWDKYLETIDKCVKNRVKEKKLKECIRMVYDPQVDEKVYKIYPDCLPEDEQNGGNGGNGNGGDGGWLDWLFPKDPNKIVGPTGVTEMRFIKPPKTMVYKVFFENMPSAKVPAKEVIVNNPLQEDLRLQDMELKSIGFGDTIIALPATNSIDKIIDLGPGNGNNKLQIVAGLDVINSEAFWRLTTIDPSTGQKPADPASGFLPSNDSTGRGEGFVKYQITLEDDVQAGTKISNQATITFDQAQEIQTNTWTNVVSGSKPLSAVKSLPAKMDTTVFTVEWEGFSGNKFGTGVSYYDIFYAKNDSTYQPWITSTTKNQAQFTGQRGNTYDFISIAFAEDGTRETRPSTADASTAIKKQEDEDDDGDDGDGDDDGEGDGDDDGNGDDGDGDGDGDDGDGDGDDGDGDTGVKEENQTTPIFTIQPNPLDGRTKVTIVLEKPGRMKLDIYTRMGVKTLNLYNNRKPAGKHEFFFHANQLPEQGIYLIRLVTEEERLTKKFSYMK